MKPHHRNNLTVAAAAFAMILVLLMMLVGCWGGSAQHDLLDRSSARVLPRIETEAGRLGALLT
jgi:hypothetical protein